MSSKYSQISCLGGIDIVEATYDKEVFPKHIHEGYAIGTLSKGAQRFFYKGENHVSTSGHLVVVNADSVHTGESASEGGWCYKAIYPTPEQISQAVAELDSSKSFAPSFLDPSVMDKDLVVHLNQIFQSQDLNYPELTTESLLVVFFMKLLKRSGNTTPTDSSLSASSNVLRVKDFIHEYSHLDIKLDELSNMSGLSKFNLLRQFKREVGITPHQYQIQMRLRNARQLLKQNKLPVDVAMACGFYDQSHFNTHFKRTYGTTPKQYFNSCNNASLSGQN